MWRRVLSIAWVILVGSLVAVVFDRVLLPSAPLFYLRVGESTRSDCGAIHPGMEKEAVLELIDNRGNYWDMREFDGKVSFSRRRDGCLIEFSPTTGLVSATRVDAGLGLTEWDEQ